MPFPWHQGRATHTVSPPMLTFDVEQYHLFARDKHAGVFQLEIDIDMREDECTIWFVAAELETVS
jgi:hypothetical protein